MINNLQDLQDELKRISFGGDFFSVQGGYTMATRSGLLGLNELMKVCVLSQLAISCAKAYGRDLSQTLIPGEQEWSKEDEERMKDLIRVGVHEDVQVRHLLAGLAFLGSNAVPLRSVL